MVSVNSKTQTFTNGTPNDAGPVDAEFVSLFNNDANLATAVTDIENGQIKTGAGLTVNSAYTGSSPANMSFMVERGTLPNTGFRWNESSAWWEVTHDGTTYFPIALVVTADPSSPTEGMAWYNSTSNQWKFYDGSATQTLATLDTASALPKGYVNSIAPLYQSASTVRIPSGFRCRDQSDVVNLIVASNLDVSLAVSGANGLDTGTEAVSTWYYLWLIRKSSDGTLAGLLSASVSSPTLPSGYDQKRLLPLAVRNDASGNIIPFFIRNAGAAPSVFYNVEFPSWGDTTSFATSVLANGTASTFTDVSAENYLPVNLSDSADLQAIAAGGDSYVRTKGVAHNGYAIKSAGTGHILQQVITVQTDASGYVQYKNGGVRTNIAVVGYHVTKYNNGF